MLLTTTTITVRRPTDGDPYETSVGDPPAVAEGVPAHIGSPSGAEARIGGQQEAVSAVLLVDPDVDVARTDIVDDEATGERYDVAWVRRRTGLGLDHTKAGLTAFKGASVG